MLYFAQKYSASPSNTFLISIDLDIVSVSKSWRFILNEVYSGMMVHELDIICLNGLSVYDHGTRDNYAIVDDQGQWIRGLVYNMYDDLWLFPNRLYQYLWWKYLINVGWYRFINVKSCFGGMTFYYSMAGISETECKYIHFDELRHMKSPNPYNSQWIVHGLRNAIAFRNRHVNVTCEHIPFHFCLGNHGFRMALSTRSVLMFES